MKPSGWQAQSFATAASSKRRSSKAILALLRSPRSTPFLPPTKPNLLTPPPSGSHPPPGSHTSKSVKKHKQRQGFHTDAGVPAWQQQEEGRGNQRCRGFGAFACSENAPKCDSAAGSSWRPPHPLATGAPGVLASLPWREFSCADLS